MLPGIASFLCEPRLLNRKVTNADQCGGVDTTTGSQYMMDHEFEWDDVKAARNWQEHGVTFQMARDGFKDAFAVEWVDHCQAVSEHRFAMLAMVGNRLMFVSYTLRGDRVRIVSARKAEPHERRRYHNANRGA
jgi:uncharacterized DUF497 family protein